ncbi:cobalamin biosynthesis protein CobG [Streptomyces clavuligerus]|nr:cobalamin biosynthesis protein CobG [Streptomyces clavuligerus]MBY6304125.1 cobalamin biosynthesis protein CobG [Streptomyces clavuligerus]QCS06906.1 cobalamin biosynthesis protein CobG [Streptomyces clavuligerus]QPJ93736.1 cobalamin biosynthesis protein CobG [Streptomyces clavuligerus]
MLAAMSMPPARADGGTDADGGVGAGGGGAGGDSSAGSPVGSFPAVPAGSLGDAPADSPAGSLADPPAGGDASAGAGRGRDPRTRAQGDACPGALRLHSADDGALARVRVPGGLLGLRQADALADAALRLGDGSLHLTSRGNVQLRGLREGCGGELAELLGAAGLLPSPRQERIRNVVATPLSGLDGRGHADVGPWLRQLDAALCAGGPLAALSGRFLFALDDGRGDVLSLGADVTLTAAQGGFALVRLGQGGDVLRVPGAAAVRAATTAAAAFLDAVATGAVTTGAVAESGRRRGVWRIAELGDGGAGLVRTVRERLRHDGVTVCTDPDMPDISASGSAGAGGHAGAGAGAAGTWSVAEGPVPGLIPGPSAADVTLSVQAPFGRITGAQWRLLTECARRDGRGELRLTPWRGVLVPAVGTAHGPGRLARLSAAGLVTGPGSPWRGVGACAGRPGCAKSLADVRADAAAVVTLTATATAAPAPVAALPVYWSGCERRCGRPPGDRVDVVAQENGYRVSTVRDGTDSAADGAGAAPVRAAPAALSDAVAAARTATPAADPGGDTVTMATARPAPSASTRAR